MSTSPQNVELHLVRGVGRCGSQSIRVRGNRMPIRLVMRLKDIKDGTMSD
jgi:hypothetical protein